MAFALDMFIFFLQGLSMSFAVTHALVKSWQEINLIFNVKQPSLMSPDKVCVHAVLQELWMFHLGSTAQSSRGTLCTTFQANFCRAVASLPAPPEMATATSQKEM